MRIATRAYPQWAFLIGAMAALALAGCVPKQTTAYNAPPAPRPAVSSGEGAVVLQAGPRTYYQDEGGRLYYADANGGLHVVEQRLRVVPGSGGIYSIVGDNDVRYFYDETGRLFYRDADGRVFYVEESPLPGKPINPLTILAPGRPMQQRSGEFCAREWNTCSRRCDESTGLTSKRSCLEDCDWKREQCLQPY